jgi:S-adenosylmethionine hydrolase
MAAPLITLTSDFGLADASVAICKGVILGIVPDARLLDVSHGVTHYATAEGAALLWAALPHMPVGVHMAVVDPGVGTDRRPLALRTGRGDFLVGPDNGLLLPAADRLGGVAATHLLANPAYRLPDVSRTFHARDVFAPAAGHLAAGIPIEAFGPALALGSLVRLDLPEPRSAGGALEASVTLIDAFGSAQLFAQIGDLEAAIGPVVSGDALAIDAADGRVLGDGGSIELHWRRTYGEAAAGEPLLCVDSYGRLSVAVNLGDAATRFGLAVDRRLGIRRR